MTPWTAAHQASLSFTISQSLLKLMSDANRKLAPDIETIIIPTAQEYAHISSTAVRDLLKHGGDTSLFVPEGVEL